ncbi:MAG: crossover junction endodeoxyribonuclease RuvC [Clostridia bacterium]|nr:crossover junction endodeoxyribonuclease RuvC [Clostridia bacterium]
MLIMGIDPGIAITGYGLIKVKNGVMTLVEFGCIRTSPDKTLEVRLMKVYSRLSQVMEKEMPSCTVIEEIFFNKNTRSAMAVGQARGVSLLASAHLNIPVHEYTPLQVKQALVGYGRAGKDQVQEMVRLLLNLEDIPRPDDASDALALAICHAHSHRLDSLIKGKGWGR